MLLLPSPEQRLAGQYILTELFKHVDSLALSSVEASRCHVGVVSAALTFYENVADFVSDEKYFDVFRICLPADAVVYQLIFNGDIMTMSRACDFLSRSKRAFELAAATKDDNYYPREFVNRFNAFLMDVCNCVWRNRAFNDSDTNASGCLLSR
jgi:centromere protein I